MTGHRHILRHRADIQGLRAIAVALVVLAHAGLPGLSGGFIGVDVFFVLSGYLITGLLIRERLATGTIRYVEFLCRRVRRLLPAMLVMMVSVFAAGYLLLTPYEMRMQAGSFAYAVSWTSNLFFAFADLDYFAELTTRDLFLHTWSLGVEEQFYLVWPWLVIFGFSFVITKYRRPSPGKNLIAVLAVIFAASFGLCVVWARTDPLLAFYMMPSRGWQFALGATVYVWFENDSISLRRDLTAGLRTERTRSLLATAGLALIFGSALLLHESLSYPGYFALAPTFGTALVLVAGSAGHYSRIETVLASPSLVWVGDRSYSIYLWHWPALVLAGAYGLTSQPVELAIVLAITLVLAAASYRFVELPFWKGRFSRGRPRQAILTSALSVLILIAVSANISTSSNEALPGSQHAQDYDPRRDLPAIYRVGAGCDSWYQSAEVVPCTVGVDSAPHKVVLIGDSIGAQWFSMLPAIYRAPDWQIIVLTKSACPMVDRDFFYKRINGIYSVCSEWRESALSYVEEIEPDLVFVGSSARYEFSAVEWQDGVKEILAPLADAAGRVVLIAGTPSLSFDAPSCLASPYRYSFRIEDSSRECEERMTDAASESVATLLGKSANQFDNAVLLNLNDLVCPEKRCAAMSRDGVTVFRDKRHLTDSFVVARIPESFERLAELELTPDYFAAEQKVASIDH